MAAALSIATTFFSTHAPPQVVAEPQRSARRLTRSYKLVHLAMPSSSSSSSGFQKRSQKSSLDAGCHRRLVDRFGLNISDAGFQLCFDVCKSHQPEEIVRAAAQLDLKKLTDKGSFPALLTSTSSSITHGPQVVTGPLFVQVVGCKNIAQPSISQNSGSQQKRCLYVQLTDGCSRAIALEHRHLPTLSLRNLAPGTKLVLRNVVFERNFLLLEPRYDGAFGDRDRPPDCMELHCYNN